MRKLYKYQTNFLLLYSMLGKSVNYKGDMINILAKSESDEVKAGRQISELERRGFLRYAYREEVKSSGLKYDGRKSYFTIGEKGWKFLKDVGIKDENDPTIDALLAKELLRREE